MPQRTGRLFPSCPGKGNRIHLPKERGLLAVRCRLSSREWANGVLGNLTGGSGDQEANKEQIHDLSLFTLELPKTFVKSVLIFESGSYLDYDHR